MFRFSDIVLPLIADASTPRGEPQSAVGPSLAPLAQLGDASSADSEGGGAVGEAEAGGPHRVDDGPGAAGSGLLGCRGVGGGLAGLGDLGGQVTEGDTVTVDVVDGRLTLSS